MYNEKIYTFLWFWMMFVGLVSCLSLILWILRALIASDRIKFITNHLHLADCLPRGNFYNRDLVQKFSGCYLRQDGAFMLRLIAHNMDSVTTTEVMCALWDNWKKTHVTTDMYRQMSPPDSLSSDSCEKRKLSDDVWLVSARFKISQVKHDWMVLDLKYVTWSMIR